MVSREKIITLTSSQDLSSAALAYTTNLSGAFELLQVLVHFGATVTETVAVSQDALAGANYDTQLDSSNLSTNANYVFRPTGRAVFQNGDQIKVTCTKATATTTAYVQVVVRDLGK